MHTEVNTQPHEAIAPQISKQVKRPFWREFIAGATAPFRGIAVLAKQPKLLLFGITPLLLGILWSLFSVLQIALPAAEAAWWLRPVHWIININLLIVIVLIAITSPLLDYLGLKVEELCKLRRRKQFRLPNLSDARYLGFMLSEAGKLFLFKTAVLLLALMPAAMPLPGPWIASLMVGLTIALDFVDYPLTRRGKSSASKRIWVRRYWPALTGFCLVTWLLFITPGLGGLMLLPIVIGGTLLVVPERL